MTSEMILSRFCPTSNFSFIEANDEMEMNLCVIFWKCTWRMWVRFELQNSGLRSFVATPGLQEGK